MKQTINIAAFFFVLAIPFALSSQTRKAIPAGRYEALSGVKNSRSVKSTEAPAGERKDSTALFWNEVLNHMPENSQDLSYFSTGKMDEFSTNLLATKGLKTAKKLNEKTNIVFSDDLKRDREVLKGLKNKSSLVVLKDSQELKDVMATLGQFEVLLYQAEDQSNYFLLKLR
ncbi:hypothetical protein DOM21_17815 [Bacteriovorax stolpii]|uniref:Uncharacterized protein n=1 Tax=Bacteriovorax stolpii TaxID=960 RepID=A0A2K9NMP2_BACTC|nr:hypothetical protein [Bacteriovorax stolpii]AUN96791.1 hypothetical protein C0V70_01460 [Bacteriovorax stolpii]QDK43278.1 hypothetical protein DOM21_17815 [Bacteriovorax stolpii]TDP53068.1 hypothetical protein C8D79_1709 [Bacteriovorax stolpii]